MRQAHVLVEILFFSVVFKHVWASDAEPRHLIEGSSALDALYTVQLRTGVIDVAAEHSRLPSLGPSARRLLQQPSAAPTTSPEWGPLVGTQLWLLTLGPELHVHPHKLSQEQQHRHSLGNPRDTSRFDSQQQPQHQPQAVLADGLLPQFGERQAELLRRLHRAGCAVVSFLPPAAWLVAVAATADLEPVTEAFPDIRMAPFGPPRLRVSPELRDVMAVLQRAGRRAAEHLTAGGRLDDLLEEATAQKAETLLGSLRVHWAPGRSAAQDRTERDGSATRGAGLGSRSEGAGAADGGGAAEGGDGEGVAAGASSAPRPRLQLEVLFPHLEPADLESLSAGGQDDVLVATGDSASGEQQRQDQQQQRRPTGQYHPAAAAAADWAAPLTALSPADCPPLLEPDHGSPEVLLVSVCAAGLEAAVEWLAGAAQVTWVAPRMAARVHNLHACSIVQTGGNMSLVKQADSSMAAHPFWVAGLRGENQTVGCGDSGLDVNHCFFNDPNVKFGSSIKTDGGGLQYFSSTTHRKLRYYLAFVQDLTDGYGHGTHVSGTLVASRTDTDNLLVPGTGQAPAAKIAFMDLSRDRTDSVWTPGDLSRSYFPRTYEQGARVHSDSWGSDLTAYDSMAQAVDRFTWINKDFLSVFAAGNSGNRQVRTTVTSPAVAKNCIAAGATLSMDAWNNARWVPMYNMTVTINFAGGQGSTRSVRLVAADFGGAFTAGLDNLPLAAAVPAEACTSLSNAGAVRDKVVMVQRGQCYFTDKARSAMAAGARAVVVYNHLQEGGYFNLEAPANDAGGNIGLPVGGVPLSTGRWLLAALNAGSVTVSFRPVVEPSGDNDPDFEDVAPYSSFGPTTDGRIKPDIVAPGSLYSAKTGGGTVSCALTFMEGTSMATPVVAGSALLVQQYFLEGFYPDGRPDNASGFTPSGALIKAVLIGGARHMTGVLPDTGMPLEDVPSYRQGFGRVSLLHSLPLPTPISPGWRLQVVDGYQHGAVLMQGQSHRFCVSATGGPLRITLVWFDYWAEPASAKALVNNLDLQVRAAGRSGVVDYGNGLIDSVNTVEQVWYADLAPGDVSINVSAPVIYVKAREQPYALVVHGKFSGNLKPPSGSNSSVLDTCAALLASIDVSMSAPLLTRLRVATFYFSLQEGGVPSSGFECLLSLQEDADATDAWQPCRSPHTYADLDDGRYVFQVRVVGEKVSAIRGLIVDATPPVTTLTSTLARGGAPANKSTITTPSDTATFTFVAQDVSVNIEFRCNLIVTGASTATVPRFSYQTMGGPVPGSGSVPGGPISPGVFACNSPLEVVGMGFGDYRFEVYAVDEAKNMEPIPKVLEWKVRFQPNTVYARMAAGPNGLTNASTLQYAVVGFRGAPQVDAPPLAVPPGGQPGQAFESLLLPVAAGATFGSEGVVAAALAQTWSPLAGPNLALTVPQDGNFLVLARPQAAAEPSTWAEASVRVDTTPPVVAVLRQPRAIQSDPRVTIQFGDSDAEGDVRVYYCRWLGPQLAPFDLLSLNDNDPPYDSTCSGSSTRDVTEGYWLFQVKGRDAAGNLGSPTNVSFRTDLSPPNITVANPSPTNATRVVYWYNVTDGPSGTGVANVNCSFKSNFLKNTSVTRGDAEYPAATSTGQWGSCPLDAAKYTVQEGSYVWSITATDGADLKSSASFQLKVDYTPPTSKVFSEPIRPGRLLPPKVTILIGSSENQDESSSGVAQQQCRLDSVTAPSPPPPPPSAPPPPLAPGTRSASVRAASGATDGVIADDVTAMTVVGGGGRGSRRRLSQQQPTGGPTVLGSVVTLKEWHVCDPNGNATNVTYEGLSTGFYTLTLRALDNAGNLGTATQPYYFAVDASLPIDGSATIEVGGDDTSDRTKKIIIGVAIIIGVLVVIGSIVAIVIVRRRHLRKRYGPPPPLAPHGANGISMQQLAPPPYINGNGHGSITAAPSVVLLPPVPSGPVVAPVPGVPYYPVVNGVVAGTPAVAPDPALAAALSLSAAEAAAHAERTRSVAAAASVAEEERLRAALAASLEEERVRLAVQASLQSAAAHQQAASEQAALDAAIAASLATAEADQRRQHQQARNQLQQTSSVTLPPPPSPPKDSLI